MNITLAERIRKLSQRHAFETIQMHEAIGRKAGLSGTDHKYLGFLLERGHLTAGELSTLTGLTSGAITGLVDRFEKKKLVKRQFSKEDRRKVYIVPDTKKIMALLEPLYKEYRQMMSEMLISFSEEEMKVLETYFTCAIEVLNKTKNNSIIDK